MLTNKRVVLDRKKKHGGSTATGQPEGKLIHLDRLKTFLFNLILNILFARCF
jgi:hypothetical protein